MIEKRSSFRMTCSKCGTVTPWTDAESEADALAARKFYLLPGSDEISCVKCLPSIRPGRYKLYSGPLGFLTEGIWYCALLQMAAIEPEWAKEAHPATVVTRAVWEISRNRTRAEAAELLGMTKGRVGYIVSRGQRWHDKGAW